ncbi:MAG TPA: host attachment protein [Gammaproteobacteria bacterium]
MSKIWVLVADSARARLFHADGSAGALQEQTDLLMPGSRLKESDLVGDRAGRAFDSGGKGRHAMDPGTSAKEMESHRFAAEIAELLQKEHLAGAFNRLTLVAPPAFLGELRSALSDGVREKVSAELDKDLVQFDSKAIREHLPERL